MSNLIKNLISLKSSSRISIAQYGGSQITYAQLYGNAMNLSMRLLNELPTAKLNNQRIISLCPPGIGAFSALYANLVSLLICIGQQFG